MSGASVPFSIPNPTTSSRLIAQVGVTQLPGDAAGVKVPSISGLGGWDIDETTGTAAARFRLWDGTSASGGNVQLADIEVSQGGNSSPAPANPIEVLSGAVFLEIVGTASIAGDIYLIT